MEDLVIFVQEHAQYAHWVIFGLFMLAGLNFPISEDLLVILGGVIASSWIPENTWKLFLAIFLGAYLSDWLVYWIGRFVGPNLKRLPWFSRIFHLKRMEQIRGYYLKYGVWTLLIGRFIPFGIRNCLFMSAGIGKMSFVKFLWADGIACLISNSTLFSLAYFCGKNCAYLVKYANIGIFVAFCCALLVFIFYKVIQRPIEKRGSD